MSLDCPRIVDVEERVVGVGSRKIKGGTVGWRWKSTPAAVPAGRLQI